MAVSQPNGLEQTKYLGAIQMTTPFSIIPTLITKGLVPAVLVIYTLDVPTLTSKVPLKLVN